MSHLLAALLASLSALVGLTLTPAAPVADGDVRIAAVGDIVCDPDSSTYPTCKHPDTAQLVAGQAATAVLLLGDTQYQTGNAGDYADAYAKTWGQFLPYSYPAVGNHEYLTPGATGYYDYFGSRVPGGPPGYYAFNVNGWRFYALNTECAKIDCDAQRAWMLADIRANPARCQAIYMHRPRYSSGDHGTSNIPRRFWWLAYKHRFDLALAGHDHDYERFAKMDSASNVVGNGIRSFVVGTGGKGLHDEDKPSYIGSQVRYRANYGVLFLDVRPGSYDWEYRTISGAVIDSGSDTCVT